MPNISAPPFTNSHLEWVSFCNSPQPIDITSMFFGTFPLLYCFVHIQCPMKKRKICYSDPNNSDPFVQISQLTMRLVDQHTPSLFFKSDLLAILMYVVHQQYNSRWCTISIMDDLRIEKRNWQFVKKLFLSKYCDWL